MLLRHTVGVQIRVSKTDRRPDRTGPRNQTDRTEVISIRSSVHPFPYFRSAERGFWKRLLADIQCLYFGSGETQVEPINEEEEKAAKEAAITQTK
nr:hypothetical protein [Tanacetum cinerariifolium]